MKLFFCGDIMPGGVIPYQDNYVNASFLTYLKSFDYRIGTLECAIGTGLSFDEDKMAAEKNIVYARNEDFFRIRELGINVVSLANNHIYDLGEDGLINTIQLLKEAGIQYCGAGMNITEASSPAIIQTDKESIAIFACSFLDLKPKFVSPASDVHSGIWQTNIDTICAVIKSAKDKYDKVVIMPHWGVELKYFPPEKEYRYSKMMIDAGADAILGSHTHTIGPIWEYKNKPICFSMGNFLFPDFAMQVPRPSYYPSSKEELSKLSRQTFYPKNLISPVVSVWKTRNRIGWGIILTPISGSFKIYKIFTNLSKNNVLSRLSGKSNIVLMIRTKVWHLLFTNFSYHKVMKCLNCRFNYWGRIFDYFIE